jgi:2-C-methyl-D-erythritol 4-phosphate cytidylyltransferase (EC 2.7.7.60)
MTENNVWAVVPAAGIGTRMQSDVPKQYLPLAGKTVIEISVEKLLACGSIRGVVVALSAADAWWQKTALANHPRITLCLGGRNVATRYSMHFSISTLALVRMRLHGY